MQQLLCFLCFIGAAINIVLDPIFIFVFNMGVRGAALATIISQTICAVWVVCFLISEKSLIRLQIEYIRYNKRSDWKYWSIRHLAIYYAKYGKSGIDYFEQ